MINLKINLDLYQKSCMCIQKIKTKKIDAKKRIAIEAIRKERAIFLMKKIVSILNPNQI